MNRGWSRWHRTDRRLVTGRRHVDLVPTLTDVMVCDYNQSLYLAHRRSGLQYETGPRHGQQLADRRSNGAKR